MNTYSSNFKKLGSVGLPNFTGTRVLMLPFLMQDIESLPDDISHYKKTVLDLIDISPVKEGVAYLTIDEKSVKKGTYLRLKGLHVDGVGPDGRLDTGIWAIHSRIKYISSLWNEGMNRWNEGAAAIGGMITVSNPAGCRAWFKDFSGKIKPNGDCESLKNQFPEDQSTIFEAGVAYWCNATCVHESLPMVGDCERIFVRLSMPSDAPWYAGYTKNPKGIKPTGIIIPSGRLGLIGEEEVILKG